MPPAVHGRRLGVHCPGPVAPRRFDGSPKLDRHEGFRMGRSLVWTLSIVLALVTGAVLSQSVALVTAPPMGTAPSETSAEVARVFYETVNRVLRTGDASALEDTVAPDFVDHSELPGV